MVYLCLESATTQMTMAMFEMLSQSSAGNTYGRGAYFQGIPTQLLPPGAGHMKTTFATILLLIVTVSTVFADVVHEVLPSRVLGEGSRLDHPAGGT